MTQRPTPTETASTQRRSWWWKLAVLLIPGCGGTAEIVDWVHEPTADLHEKYDIEREALAPFRLDDVVVAPRFVALSHTTTAVKLIAASRTAGSITVEGARLSGAGTGGRTLAEHHEVALASAPDDRIFKGFATLGEVPNAELEALSGGSPLTLSLDLRSGDSARSVDFQIARHTRKYVVSP